MKWFESKKGFTFGNKPEELQVQSVIITQLCVIYTQSVLNSLPEVISIVI